MSLVTIGRPEDVDLAVPPLTPGRSSGQTLRQIADGYSQWVTKDWARACNVEYRAGASGPSVSLIAESGKVWTTGDPRWPVMLATDAGAAIKDNPSEAEVTAARWAFSAGPWLVRDGKPTDLRAEIAKGGYSGFIPGVLKEQAGIGIRSDGVVVHCASRSATIEELVSTLLAQGCVDAIKLDGGGSVGVVDPSGKVILGYTMRQVCCALVFRRLIDDSLPQDSQPSQPPQPKGGDQMLVCIDPGHGGSDPGAVSKDGAQEKVVNLFVAQRIKTYLERAGAKVLMARTDDSDVGLADRAAKANQAKCDYFVSIHANAADAESANGYEVFHYPGSSGGASLANKVSRTYKVASGMPLRRVTSANFQVLRDTLMPAILIELGFLTSPLDLALLKEPAFLDKVALGIAFGVGQPT